jgi:hypothetical protein
MTTNIAASSFPGHEVAANTVCPGSIATGADLPEYDLDTDDLVYRNRAGSELLRERFESDAREDIGVYAEVAL